MSPQYTVKHDTDWSGNQRTTIREQPTGSEIAGTVLGMAFVARQKARQRDMLSDVNAFEVAVAKGEFERALKTAEGLASNSNRDIRGVGDWLRARALRYLGRPDEAIKAATAATQAMETSSDPDAQMGVNYAQCELGWANLMIGNAPTAITAFTRAIKIVPEDQEAFNGRGIALRQLGNYEQSLRDFERAIQISPGEKEHYAERGLTFLEMGHQERALSDFTQAVRLAPNASIGYRLRAQAYSKVGEHVKAEADLSQAATLEHRMATLSAYRDTANAIYDRGVTEIWQSTKPPLTTKTKLARAATLAIGPLVILTVILSMLTGWFSSEASLSTIIVGVLQGLLVFIFWWLLPLAGLTWLGDSSEARKKAQQYFAEMTSAESKLPGFTEFYRIYLDARKKNQVGQLEEKTRHLFEEGGAARKYVTDQVS